jgi:hypothetical protein
MLVKLSTHNSLIFRKNKTKEVIAMAKNSRSKTQFENMKYEIAKEVGVNLKQGYNGDLTAREAGKIGGNIVKKVFQSYTGNSYPSERLGDTSR